MDMSRSCLISKPSATGPLELGWFEFGPLVPLCGLRFPRKGQDCILFDVRSCSAAISNVVYMCSEQPSPAIEGTVKSPIFDDSLLSKFG